MPCSAWCVKCVTENGKKGKTMITLQNDSLRFLFKEVFPGAQMSISFQRTLRIPDNGKTYYLPPGLGCFPIRHVDDFAQAVPAAWMEHGGVMLPMYQSEAMWLSFDSEYIPERETAYPFAVKIATGKVDAVSGTTWRDGLHRRPQDYVAVPGQPWLDGYCVEKGTIRQFVAMPLGSGYTAEEQVTGKAEHGGLQIAVYPMKREVFEKRFPKVDSHRMRRDLFGLASLDVCCCVSDGMGLAPGGRMKQEIYRDRFDLDDWDQTAASRCFVHIANSMMWRQITGEQPPTTPLTAKEYTDAGLPWFDYYDDRHEAVDGASVLAGMKSVAEMAQAKGDAAVPDNVDVKPEKVIVLGQGKKAEKVREWTC